jgi:4-diphosphocytidyl-2-C-methyl-D-erythritol kinase
MPTRVRSHAKINLGLFLGAPRADGFHALTTVYQTLEMHDFVTVTARIAAETRITLTSNDTRVPTDERNTAWKMIFLVLEEFGVRAAVDIHIEKRLPVQGGLGAGSGNAAAALVGLEKELEKQEPATPSNRDRSPGTPTGIRGQGSGTRASQRAGKSATQRISELEIAAKVGSDVPLFLVGGTVLGVDRGQEVYPLPDMDPVWCVVAVPEIGISTPQAFRDWDALCAAKGLTEKAAADRLEKSSRAYARAFRRDISEGGPQAGSSGVFSLGEDLAGPQESKRSELVRTGIMSWVENDFERVVFSQHPSLAEIKRLLACHGTPEAALFASLSGSGSALFGLYLTRGDAEAAKERVERQAPGTRAQVTQTLPRKEYWEKMIEDS